MIFRQHYFFFQLIHDWFFRLVLWSKSIFQLTPKQSVRRHFALFNFNMLRVFLMPLNCSRISDSLAEIYKCKIEQPVQVWSFFCQMYNSFFTLKSIAQLIWTLLIFLLSDYKSTLGSLDKHILGTLNQPFFKRIYSIMLNET